MTNPEMLRRKRKMLLFLPVIAVPLLCLLFYAFGGGKGVKGEVASPGINTAIPATTNSQILGKDEAYAQLLKDSIDRMNAQQENLVYGDPYAKALQGGINTDVVPVTSGTADNPNTAVKNSLNEMSRAINEANEREQRERQTGGSSALADYQQQIKLTNDLLQNDPQYQLLMQQMKLGNQKPDSVNARVVAQKENNYVPVQNAQNKKEVVTMLLQAAPEDDTVEHRFLNGLSGTTKRTGINTIAGVIHQDQTVRDGAVIKIRLDNDINLSGLVIPRNSFVYGQASFAADRLNITIASITYNNSIYPVKLSVYDIDGLLGIRVPGAAETAERKQAVQQIVNGSSNGGGGQGVSITTTTSAGQQIAAQATGALLESGKQLLSRKLAEQKVFLKANYKIYLKQSS